MSLDRSESATEGGLEVVEVCDLNLDLLIDHRCHQLHETFGCQIEAEGDLGRPAAGIS